MPEEAYWETLFNVPLILDRLEVDARLKDVVELGCGYGTFTLPVAQRISGEIKTVDVEPAMIERTRQRAVLPIGPPSHNRHSSCRLKIIYLGVSISLPRGRGRVR